MLLLITKSTMLARHTLVNAKIESKKEMTKRHRLFLKKRFNNLNEIKTSPGNLLQRKLHLESQRDILKGGRLNEKAKLSQGAPLIQQQKLQDSLSSQVIAKLRK
jgi:hypothetical protein